MKPPHPEPQGQRALVVDARSRWEPDAEGWVLHLGGDWRRRQGHGPARDGPVLAPLPDALTAADAPAAGETRVSLEAGGLVAWDGRLASALWQRLAALDPARVDIDLQGLPRGLAQVLARALAREGGEGRPAPETRASTSLQTTAAPPSGPAPTLLPSLRRRVAASAGRAHATLTFVGQTLFALARLARGRTDMRRADWAWQLEQTGPASLPIVALVSFLVGLIVAYMGAAQLERFGAETFVAELVTIGVVREIAALLVGIVLAGRVGAAFAAQLGSMRANEEVDALATLGVDPVGHLVLPRLLALVIVGPVLTAFAAAVGIAVGGLVAVGVYDVALPLYLSRSLGALTLPHVAVGLVKGTVYAALVALAGCRQGLAAGRSAAAVGEATTASVVQAIVWMVVAASVLTVMAQQLGI